MVLEGEWTEAEKTMLGERSNLTETTAEPFLWHIDSENEKESTRDMEEEKAGLQEEYMGVLCACMEMS